VLCQLSYIPVLTCGFASHHASCTVAQHSNSTITAAQDWTAWALWVAVVSAPLAASGRGYPSSRAQPESPSVYGGDIMSSAGDLLVTLGWTPDGQRSVYAAT
jgi:hypothetical protein